MSSKFISVKDPSEDEGYRESVKEKFRTSYAMLMLRLQEMCGLTYREARAYLVHHRETEERMAEDLGITTAAVKNLKSRAAWKVRCSGYDLAEIVGDHGLILTRFTEPKDIVADGTRDGEPITFRKRRHSRPSAVNE